MRPTRWPCIFKRPEIRADVNPRLQRAYREYVKPDGNPPYAALQGLWRREHCREINPYGSESCPYEARDCILAYYQTSMKAIETPGIRSVTGLFRIIAKRYGLERSDNRPLARDRIRSTNGPQEVPLTERPRIREALDADLEERRRLRSSGLRSVGSLFGKPDS